MKRIQIFLLAIITSITLNSCNGTKEITIIGKPGTEIYSNDMQKISVIDNKGIAIVDVNNSPLNLNCVPFDCVFFSHEKESNTYIPFALNFEKKKFGDNQLWAAVFISLFPLPPPVNPFIYMVELEDLQTKYHFKYLPEQTTNQDIVFTPLKQTADYKTLDKSSQNVSQTKANTERRKFNSGGSQSNKDPMSVITGTYSGKGELLDGSDVIEEYTDLSIVIKKKSENTVSVEVLASDGYSYFDEEMIYSVNRQDNQYVLKQKGSNSRIVIKNGNLSYSNHNINDGDMVYTLKINANK